MDPGASCLKVQSNLTISGQLLATDSAHILLGSLSSGVIRGRMTPFKGPFMK